MSLRNKAAALVVAAIAVTMGLMLGGGVRSAHATEVPISVDGGWVDFNWSGAGSVFADEGPFTFSSLGSVEVKVTDDFCRGDQFTVYDFDVPLGDTSAVAEGGCEDVGPDAAFVDPSYSSGTFPLGPGDHSITIEVIVNPFEGGGAFIRVDLVPTITLDPPSDTNTVGDDHAVTAKLDIGGDPLEGVEVQFEVIDGPNAGEVSDPGTGECSVNDDCTSDGAGTVSWTYTGDGGAGTDTIEACFFDEAREQDVCDTATKEWVEPEPTPTSTPTSTPAPTVLAATATPAPTPTVLAAVQLPSTGGEPTGGSSALTWLAAIAGAIALIGSGSAWFAYQRRRVR